MKRKQIAIFSTSKHVQLWEMTAKVNNFLAEKSAEDILDIQYRQTEFDRPELECIESVMITYLKEEET